MTKSEFNRISNYIGETGPEQDGSLRIHNNEKNEEKYPSLFIFFSSIQPSNNMFTIKSSIKPERISIVHRKDVKVIRLSGMYGWKDIKGERQKRLDKIL